MDLKGCRGVGGGYFDQKDRLYAAAGRKRNKELLLSERYGHGLEPDLWGCDGDIDGIGQEGLKDGRI